MDGARLSCAGGTAGLDLALQIIARDHGAALSRRVSEWFIQPSPREGTGLQRGSLMERYRSSHPAVLAAISAMEERIADPLPRATLADYAGVSLRQLERLFNHELGHTIGKQYRSIRLEAAKRLLRETTLSRIEISVACGFADVSHFSRVFRETYGVSPSQIRAMSSLVAGRRQVSNAKERQ
jgi:transcriptional regulator GlxA family with amidase domain